MNEILDSFSLSFSVDCTDRWNWISRFEEVKKKKETANSSSLPEFCDESEDGFDEYG